MTAGECADCEDRSACGEPAVWWTASSGDDRVAFGFGPAAQDALAELAKAAGEDGDFLQQILVRASILAEGGGPARFAVAASDSAPAGDLHIARFKLDSGKEFEVAMSCAPGAETPAPPANSHAFQPDRMGILLKVAVPVTILLGKANLPLKETLKLTRGSVVDLDRTFNDPVEVVVNDQVVARGDIVVVEEKYAVRIREIYRDASNQVWTGFGAGAHM